MQAVGSGNRSFDSFCGVMPDALDTTTELEVGGSVSGTVCFVVPEADVSSGEWHVYVSSGLGERVTFFAVS